MINSSRLRVLLEIARLGTIVAAARQLQLSPSAVSHQLSALEREVGVALVERGPHSIGLTPAGERLADYAQQITDLMSAARDELTAHGQATRGVLRVGFFATAGTELLPRALSTFSHARPGVEVDLILGQPHELLPQLAGRELDLVVVFEHPLEPWRDATSCDVTSLLHDPQVVVLPPRHPLAGRQLLRLTELARDPWVTTRGTDSSVSVLERAAIGAGFRPRIRCKSDHYEVTLALVRAGLGVALVPALGLHNDHGVATVPLDHPGLHREVGVATRRNNPNPTVRAFVEHLRTAAGEVARELDRRAGTEGHGPDDGSAASRATRSPHSRSDTTQPASPPGGAVDTTA
ncbi:molybdate transport repressor ModE-like protein [Haloactinopolyspora alba]|uniref:Molybdate transport repressor ModE-like protein n=1 Tax=Haloactinopolyspora alba TaxID=648780 RepID=A0A2P8EG39_9ACTN|nr:LysR family transcriptional regulator [Haloactinopolyspora alba]PSL08431.1 molybdate transport repressor ModE-like protein [Haloactinopolyspora alba]